MLREGNSYGLTKEVVNHQKYWCLGIFFSPENQLPCAVRMNNKEGSTLHRVFHKWMNIYSYFYICARPCFLKVSITLIQSIKKSWLGAESSAN